MSLIWGGDGVKMAYHMMLLDILHYRRTAEKTKMPYSLHIQSVYCVTMTVWCVGCYMLLQSLLSYITGVYFHLMVFTKCCNTVWTLVYQLVLLRYSTNEGLSTVAIQILSHKPLYSSVTSREYFFSFYHTLSACVYLHANVYMIIWNKVQQEQEQRGSLWWAIQWKLCFITHVGSQTQMERTEEVALFCMTYLSSAQSGRLLIWMEEVMFTMSNKLRGPVTMQIDLLWFSMSHVTIEWPKLWQKKTVMSSVDIFWNHKQQ